MGKPNDRVADQLSGAMIGHGSSAIRDYDLCPGGPEWGLTLWKMIWKGTPADRIDSGVLKQEQRIGSLVSDTLGVQPLLKEPCIAIIKEASHHEKASASGLLLARVLVHGVALIAAGGLGSCSVARPLFPCNVNWTVG